MKRTKTLVYVAPKLGKGSTVYGGPVLFTRGYGTYTNTDTLLGVRKISW